MYDVMPANLIRSMHTNLLNSLGSLRLLCPSWLIVFLLRVLVHPGQQRLDFLPASAVRQLAPGTRRRSGRLFQILPRFGSAIPVNQILAIKKFGSIPSGLMASDFLKYSSARALSPKPIGQPGTLA